MPLKRELGKKPGSRFFAFGGGCGFAKRFPGWFAALGLGSGV